MGNCPSFDLPLSNVLEHFLVLLHVRAEQWPGLAVGSYSCCRDSCLSARETYQNI